MRDRWCGDVATVLIADFHGGFAGMQNADTGFLDM